MKFQSTANVHVKHISVLAGTEFMVEEYTMVLFYYHHCYIIS